MKVYQKDGNRRFFHQHVGKGTCRGVHFDLSVAMNAGGDLIGLPIIMWENGPTVVVEVDEIVALAYKAAFGEGE